MKFKHLFESREPMMLRDKWPKGEWDNEPDHLEFTYKKYNCIVWRNSFGNLNGYVILPPSHPLAGKHYYKDDELSNLDVHGGLTYSRDYKDVGTIIGFDCGHAEDYQPAMQCWRDEIKLMNPFREYSTYKNVAFVKKEIRKLINQIIKSEK